MKCIDADCVPEEIKKAIRRCPKGQYCHFEEIGVDKALDSRVFFNLKINGYWEDWIEVLGWYEKEV